jgi:hypothetical protein
MLASTPANILNHKSTKNGIPSDSAKSRNALDRNATNGQEKAAYCLVRQVVNNAGTETRLLLKSASSHQVDIAARFRVLVATQTQT